jgi:hypothetical protein
LPDINRWDIKSLRLSENMFKDCKLIENKIPQKFKEAKN